MQALLGPGQVTNAQQLQGPVLHGIRTHALAMGPAGTKQEGRQRFEADGLNAAAMALPRVAGLEEGDRDGLALLTGAGQSADAFDNL